MNDETRFAILGAGNGGQAVAADLGARGYAVRLFNRTPGRLEPIRRQGGIHLVREDGSRAFGPLELASSDLGQVLEGTDVVLVVVPATAHREVATRCAPFLRDGQVVILCPGRTGGALEFRQALREAGCRAQVVVAEAQTLVVTSRQMEPGTVRVFQTKQAVPLAALPATDTPKALEAVRRVYPQFVAVPNVLYTSLDNMGIVFHPALTVVNASRIEHSGGDFEFFTEGVTPAVARLLEEIDRERIQVAAALGVEATPALRWLEIAYGVRESDLYRAIQANPGYRGIRAPRSLDHRYVVEEVPTGLVPISSLGARFGVPTRAIDAIIRTACILCGVDFYAQGRTIERLGLQGLSAAEITRYVERGLWE